MISGNILQKLRMLKGINQKTISEKMGISQPAYCKLEKCKYIKGETLSKILIALNCKREELDKLLHLLPPPPPGKV